MVFRVFDKHYKGKLSKEDVGEAMRSIGKRALPGKIDAFFCSADKDNDGFVDANEFVDYMLRKRHAKQATEGSPKKKSPRKAKPTARSTARTGRGKKAKTEKEEEAVLRYSTLLSYGDHSTICSFYSSFSHQSGCSVSRAKCGSGSRRTGSCSSTGRCRCPGTRARAEKIAQHR